MLLVLKLISVHGNFARDFTEDYKMINQNTATVTVAATKTQDATQTQKLFANDAVRKLVEGFLQRMTPGRWKKFWKGNVGLS